MVVLSFIVKDNMYSQANLALGKTATADSEINGIYIAANAVDTVISQDSRWMSAKTDFPHWLEVDLGTPFAVDSGVLKFNDFSGAGVPSGFSIQLWDGAVWQDTAVFSGNTNATVSAKFAPGITSKIKMYATVDAPSGDKAVRLYEMEVYGDTISATAYMVTFNVTDGTNPVENATVSLSGYGEKTTNASGAAIFINVASANDIAYTVNATNFQQGAGTISIKDVDVTENVTLLPSSGQEVTRANLALGKTATADSEINGLYVAANAVDTVLSQDSRWISAKTSFPHWLEVDLGTPFSIDSVVLKFNDFGGAGVPSGFSIQLWDGTAWQDTAIFTDNTNDTISAEFSSGITSKIRMYATVDAPSGDLAVRLYEIEIYGDSLPTITFNVTDGTNPVENATVSLSGYGEKTTNASGAAIFNNVAPANDIAYTVNATNFQQGAGTVTITNADVTENIMLSLKLYSLTVVNGTGSGDYAPGQEVTIVALTKVDSVFTGWTGNTESLADINKDTTMLVMPQNNATVTATYKEVTKMYSITITVLNGTNALQDAKVVLNDVDSLMTSVNGEAVFSSILPGTYSYTISKEGFVPSTGTILVEDADVVVSDTLKIISGIAQTSIQTTVYPNPANNILTISSNTNINKAVLYDVTGNTIKTYIWPTGNKHIVYLEDVVPGIYLLQVYEKEKPNNAAGHVKIIKK